MDDKRLLLSVGGRPVLCKAGGWMLCQGTANSDLEPFSEYPAAQVAEAMGVPHVSYGLERWKGHLASTCACFCSERASFVTMRDACRVSGFVAMACAKLAQSEAAPAGGRLLLRRETHCNFVPVLRGARFHQKR